MRPIDADALYDMMHDNACHDVVGIADVLDFIEIAPTIDYEPVEHGNWGPPEIIGYNGLHAVYGAPCSECGAYSREYHRLFCSNCGAKMDSKK